LTRQTCVDNLRYDQQFVICERDRACPRHVRNPERRESPLRNEILIILKSQSWLAIREWGRWKFEPLNWL